MTDSFLIEKLVYLIRDASFSAKDAHKILFQEDPKKDNRLFALAYLNCAISRMSAAEAVYISHYDVLERTEIQAIFNTFETFSSEFLKSLSTDHSPQWTDIEYERFIESLYFIDNR